LSCRYFWGLQRFMLILLREVLFIEKYV